MSTFATVTYDSLMRSVADRMGWDPDTLDAAQWRSIRRALDQALDKAWKAAFWPELCLVRRIPYYPIWTAGTYARGVARYHVQSNAYYAVVSSSTTTEPATQTSPGTYSTDTANWAKLDRNYAVDTWNSTTAYAVGDVRLYAADQNFYQLFASAPAGTLPTDSTKWGPVPVLVPVIPKAGSGQLTILAVEGVYCKDPRTSPGAAGASWDETSDGYVVHDRDVNWPFVRFLRQRPRFTGEAFDAAATYSPLSAYDNFTLTLNP